MGSKSDTNRMHDRHEKRAANQAAHAAERKELTEGRANQRAGLRSLKEVAKMVSPFERPVERTANLDPRLMTDAQLIAHIKASMHVDRYDWRANGRQAQFFPVGATIWLLMAGRGFGKTRAAVEALREICRKPGMRVAFVAKDHRALRNVCLEGPSGIEACFPPGEIKKVHRGLGDVSVELTNGSVMIGYTGGEPDAVRGMAFDAIWGDEFAAWPKNKAQDMLDQLRLCLRESKVGAICILSTTPKRIPHVMEIMKLAKDPDEKITVTHGRSRDNTVLTEEWHRQMERKYGGTRLGRQELDGELVMDNELALWTGRMIDESRWSPSCTCEKDVCACDFGLPKLVGVMTGVDPSGSKDGDETGIVTCGWTRDKQIFVLENVSRKGDPGERYAAACLSAHRWGSAEIWYESAYGGDNAAFGIKQSWKNLQREDRIPAEAKCPLVKASTMKGDKAARAMPVVALYEQQMNRPEIRRIWNVEPTEDNGIAKLEEECLVWETDAKKSPNAIDALVHCVRAIMRRTGQDGSVSSAAKGPRRIPGGGAGAARRIVGGWNPYQR